MVSGAIMAGGEWEGEGESERGRTGRWKGESGGLKALRPPIHQEDVRYALLREAMGRCPAHATPATGDYGILAVKPSFCHSPPFP